MERPFITFIFEWIANAWGYSYLRLFVYDGDNLATESGGSGHSICGDLCGTDLIGVGQGSGGEVELSVIDEAIEPFCFVSYDQNGDRAKRGDVDSWTLSGHAEENVPREENLEVPQLTKGFNLSRLPSEDSKTESGLSHYGYRYYNPSTGRWLNRDPIGERGGVNVYGFIDSDPVSSVDFLGLLEIVERTGGGVFIHLQPCEIVFYFGHGNAKNSPAIVLPTKDQCSAAAGVIACFADRANQKLKKHGSLIPGAPTADDSGDAVWAGEIDPRTDRPEIETAFKAMEKGVVTLVNKWLKETCCKTVKVYFVDINKTAHTKSFTKPIKVYRARVKR